MKRLFLLLAVLLSGCTPAPEPPPEFMVLFEGQKLPAETLARTSHQLYIEADPLVKATGWELRLTDRDGIVELCRGEQCHTLDTFEIHQAAFGNDDELFLSIDYVAPLIGLRHEIDHARQAVVIETES